MDTFSGHGLTCVRGERVLFENLGFELKAGDLLLVLGPNGAGKTSLLRILAGLASPATGEVRWDGHPVDTRRDDYGSRLHFVGHLPAISQALTVRENLTFLARLRSPTDEHILSRALDRFDLTPLADLSARLLSAGQSRRLALARLLATEARLWVLDEPATALDPQSRETVLEAVAYHRDRGGIAVVATNTELDIDSCTLLQVTDYLPALQ